MAFGQTAVVTPELGARIIRYELADHEWTIIKPMLPNKPRGSSGERQTGLICPRRLAHTPLATTALSAGGGLVSKAAS